MRIKYRFLVGFELTPLCNFRCKMCYIRLDRAQQEARSPLLTSAQWLDIANQACDMGALYVTLTGGEVFTRPDFREIYEGFCNLGCMISILTNGYLIDDEKIKWLSEYPFTKLRVSLYGASNDIYKRICGVDDGYTVVTRNVEKMLEAGLSVGVGMTLQKDNEDDKEKVSEYAQRLNIPIERSRDLLGPLPGVKSVTEQIDLKKIYGETTNYCYEKNLTSDRALEDCKAFGHSCWITLDGRMQLCATSHLIYENAFAFKESWQMLYHRLSELKRPETCRNCEYMKYCSQCYGAIQSYSHSLTEVDDRSCQRAKEFYKLMNN